MEGGGGGDQDRAGLGPEARNRLEEQQFFGVGFD